MNAPRFEIQATVCLVLLVAVAPVQARRVFTQPVLVKGSPTNYGTNGFDISWVDNPTQKYYLADRTNNAIDRQPKKWSHLRTSERQGHLRHRASEVKSAGSQIQNARETK